MLFLVIVIAVCLPAISQAQTDITLKIAGIDYKADCTIKRANAALIGTGGSTNQEQRRRQDPIDLCAIRGIPYANASRFERPQPLDSAERTNRSKVWKNEDVHCAQIDPFEGTFLGVEDCLVVDLYFPKNWKDEAEDGGKSLVILLEGMDFETSLAGFLQPEFSLKSQLKYMLAVVHYRTGVFGFMTLEDQLMPANLGLWDQQMALQFLKNETANLGVQEKFIVLGFGSGATALHLHMMNPVSQKLFKRVLLSGGNALSPGATRLGALNTTLTLASRLKCDISTKRAVAKCLREKTKDELLEQSRATPTLRFATLVDANSSDAESKNVFISAPLEDLVRSHVFGDMEAIIHGYPAVAGLNRFLRNKDIAEGEQAQEGDVKYLAKFFDMYSNRTAESVAKTVLDQLSKKTKTDIEADPTEFIALLTDFTVGNPVNSLASRHVTQNGENKVQLGSYVIIDNRGLSEDRKTPPRLISKLKIGTGDTTKLGFGSTLDDMLLFVGCKKAPLWTKSDGTTPLYTTAPAIINNADNVIDPIMICLLVNNCENILLKPNEEYPERGYTGQQSLATDKTRPHRFDEVSRWSSVLALASAMDKLEADNTALEREKEKRDSVSAAGASFWGMLVALILLAVIVIILVGVLVKMVRDRRQGPSLSPIEKPARSGAQYNVGMDSVTIEDGARM